MRKPTNQVMHMDSFTIAFSGVLCFMKVATFGTEITSIVGRPDAWTFGQAHCSATLDVAFSSRWWMM